MLEIIWVTECAFSSRQTIHFECALVSFALKTMTYSSIRSGHEG